MLTLTRIRAHVAVMKYLDSLRDRWWCRFALAGGWLAGRAVLVAFFFGGLRSVSVVVCVCGVFLPVSVLWLWDLPTFLTPVTRPRTHVRPELFGLKGQIAQPLARSKTF